MKYNCAIHKEAKAAMSYLERLMLKGCVVEVKKVDPRRSLSQNNYLHLLLTAWGDHFGYSLQESKYIYKELNKDIYEYKKQSRTFYRSSRELDSKQMNKSIEVFRHQSMLMGYPLPAPEDKEWLRQLDNEIARSSKQL